MTQKLPSYIAANFSVQMLSDHAQRSGCSIEMCPLTLEEARELAVDILAKYPGNARAASAVGYANSADVIGHTLGIDLRNNRAKVSLEIGQSILLCIIQGRLEEYSLVLPLGMEMRCFELTVVGY